MCLKDPKIIFVKDTDLHEYRNKIDSYSITNDNDITDKIEKETFGITIINVEKYKNVSYNKCSRFDLWCKLIRIGKWEELEEFIDNCTEEIIIEGIKEMMRFMFEGYIQNQDREEMLIKCRMENLAKKREEKSRLAGLKEGKYEVARNFLENTDTSLEVISTCTGISVSELKKIQKQNKFDKRG